MNLFFTQKQCRGDGMHRGVTPPLIKESARLIQILKILSIRITSVPIKVANFKIAPEMTQIITNILHAQTCVVICNKCERRIRMEVLGVFLKEFLCSRPKALNSLEIFVEGHDKTVVLVVFAHKGERVVVKVAVKFGRGLNTPVPKLN